MPDRDRIKTVEFYTQVVDAAQEVGIRKFIKWTKELPDLDAHTKSEFHMRFKQYMNEQDKGRGR